MSRTFKIILLLTVTSAFAAEEKTPEKRELSYISKYSNGESDVDGSVAYATARVSPQYYAQAKSDSSGSQQGYLTQAVMYTAAGNQNTAPQQFEESQQQQQQQHQQQVVYVQQPQTSTKLNPVSQPKSAEQRIHYSPASAVSSFSYSSPIVSYNSQGVLKQSSAPEGEIVKPVAYAAQQKEPQQQQQYRYVSQEEYQKLLQSQKTAQEVPAQTYSNEHVLQQAQALYQAQNQAKVQAYQAKAQEDALQQAQLLKQAEAVKQAQLLKQAQAYQAQAQALQQAQYKSQLAQAQKAEAPQYQQVVYVQRPQAQIQVQQSQSQPQQVKYAPTKIAYSTPGQQFVYSPKASALGQVSYESQAAAQKSAQPQQQYVYLSNSNAAYAQQQQQLADAGENQQKYTYTFVPQYTAGRQQAVASSKYVQQPQPQQQLVQYQ